MRDLPDATLDRLTKSQHEVLGQAVTRIQPDACEVGRWTHIPPGANQRQLNKDLHVLLITLVGNGNLLEVVTYHESHAGEIIVLRSRQQLVLVGRASVETI